MASPPQSPPLAKAALYYFPKSIWSAVALLAVEEKGYGPDELDRKIVDLNKSENNLPAYLKINPKGTVPCLVVPLEKTLGSGNEAKYKALTDSTVVLEFLDKSRSANSRTHTTSDAPAHSLSPATVSLSAKSKAIIALAHDDGIAPVKVMTSARDQAELIKKSKAYIAQMQKSRLEHLTEILKNERAGVDENTIQLWERKLTGLRKNVSLLSNAEKKEDELDAEQKSARESHYAMSKKLWTEDLKIFFANLEKEIIGPFCLGDQLSLADLHLAAWVTRAVVVVGGPANKDGVDAIAAHAATYGGEPWSIGPKVKDYWGGIIERDSWKAIYAGPQGMF